MNLEFPPYRTESYEMQDHPLVDELLAGGYESYDHIPWITTAWCRGPAHYSLDYCSAWLANMVTATYGMVRGYEFLTDRPKELERHLKEDPRFNLDELCVKITDIAQQCLHFGASGYWCKMMLYDPVRIGKRTFWIDLDTIALRNLRDLLAWQPGAPMVMYRDWIGYGGKYSSGVMSINLGPGAEVLDAAWLLWKRKSSYIVRAIPQGDQAFISESFTRAHQEPITFPEGWIGSWKWRQDGPKYENLKRGLKFVANTGNLKDSFIMCFHGRPKPHEETSPIVKTLWRPR